MTNSDVTKESLGTTAIWTARFNALTIRERGLVCAAVLGTTLAIWFYFSDQHFTGARASIQRDIQMTQSENRAYQQERITLNILAAKDPNEPIRNELAIIRAELTDMETNLLSSLSQFIPPNVMTVVLRDVMSDHKNVRLTRLNRLPARQLLPEDEGSNLYLHPMRLELEGKYLDVLKYVRSLEDGDWQFNWRHFDYKVGKYPSGIATIEIETLSRDKHWLGL